LLNFIFKGFSYYAILYLNDPYDNNFYYNSYCEKLFIYVGKRGSIIKFC